MATFPFTLTTAQPSLSTSQPLFVSGVGQYHSNEEGVQKPKPYHQIGLTGIRQLVDTPQQVDKTQSQWLIPSTLLSRIYKEQEEKGQYWLLWADIDNNPDFGKLIEIVKLSLPGYDFEAYTTRSATAQNQKARVIILLAKPLCYVDWHLCQELFNDLLEAYGVTPDRATERAAQLCYLPNRGAFYKSSSSRNGVLFDPITLWAVQLQQKREEAIKVASDKLEEQKNAAVSRREALKSSDASSAIGAFNQAYTVQEMLSRAGYAQQGNKFRHLNSSSGSYSVSVENGRVHSLSTNDPLYTNGGGVGGHDAFSAFTVLFHNKDQNSALNDVGENWLTINGESWNTVKQREYRQGQADASKTNRQPQPLTGKIDPKPYPIDALPNVIRDVVNEVHGFVKAPIPLIASSCISALSLAIQAHVDTQRAENLEGPCGLFMLTIGDSGERKSTCDKFFTKAIRDYECRQDELFAPEIKQYDADMSAWNAEREGILSAIKNAGKAGKSTNNLKQDLARIQEEKPAPLLIPKMLLGDETPENLAWRLAKQWPSSGIVSSEAGIVFGSHGMGNDSIMRNLSLYNVLWDGSTHTVGRKTSESFTVSDARLTVGLQIQEATLREFFEKSGKLARGTGFFARLLVAWPESTQGSRLYTEPPEHWFSLVAFNSRMSQILDIPAPIEDGKLKPRMLSLSPEAKSAWIQFHDDIERELASGKEFCDVRDVASKAADNAARLAALFYVFRCGFDGQIDRDSFESASRIVAWHLHESRRFFGELALPAELADAVRLDNYLIDYCNNNKTHIVGKRVAQQYGPVRKKEKLDQAIDVLVEHDRVEVDKEGKRTILKINPALLQHKGGPD